MGFYILDNIGCMRILAEQGSLFGHCPLFSCFYFPSGPSVLLPCMFRLRGGIDCQRPGPCYQVLYH